MGRPSKQTVEFFSHDCNSTGKKTLYTLQYKFGNNGYAFWFKMLELLGSSEGHWFSCRKPDEWEFFVARMGVEDSICAEILSSLVLLEAIDKELWVKHKVIWCQNFVNRLKPFYDKRVQKLPECPSFRDENPMDGDISGDGNPPDRSGNRQRDRQSKESKERDRGIVREDSYESSPFLPLAKRILENALNVNKHMKSEAGYDEAKKLKAFVAHLELLGTRTWPQHSIEQVVSLANKIWDWVLTHEGSNGFRWREVILSGHSFYKGCSSHLKNGGNLIAQYEVAKNKQPGTPRGPQRPTRTSEETISGKEVFK